MRQYITVSVVQGGCGFPFLSESMYDYPSTGKCTGIDVKLEEAVCNVGL